MMGRLAGGTMVHCRGLAGEVCPDYIKTELRFKNILNPGAGSLEPKLLLVIADISGLSSESQYYLRLMEICKPDKYNSTLDDALALSDFIIEFCDTYSNLIGESYSILLVKALALKGLSSSLVGSDDLMAKFLEPELREQMRVLKDLTTHLFDVLPLRVASSC